MLAAVITEPGGPEVLEVRDEPDPVPGAEEVLVRVVTSSLNRADLLQRRGQYPAPPGSPQHIPGMEYAGEIAALGANVRGWREGERVFGLVGGGAHAELVTVDARTCTRVPDGLSWEDAGAAPEAFITAHDALITQAGLAAGERVLIHAVASGVGLAAVQVARAAGAIPYGTSRTPDKLASARAVGLEDGLAIVGDPRELVTWVAERTGGKGVEVVLDLVGGAYFPASLEALAMKGRLVLVGTVAGPRADVELRRILGRRLTIRGTVLRARPLDEKIAVARVFAADVVPRLARGELTPVIDRVYPLGEIAEAHRRMESNATVGKVVLRVAPE